MRPGVLVAGLGAMGSAVARELARRGARVIGLDRHTPPHPHGSSHGESRIIREAYFEDPAYVPLVRRAHALWEELERESGRPLLRRTGAVMVGDPASELIAGATRSAVEHAIPHELLDADQTAARFPVFHPAAGMVGLYEERAGVLDPEACIGAQLEGAATHGAELRYGETLLAWRADGEGVEVRSDRARYRVDRLVLCVGPWLPALLPELPLEVERQMMLWFEPHAARADFAPGRCPVFLWEREDGALYYGVPDLGTGVKAARHHGGVRAPLSEIDPAVRPEDVADVRGFLRRHLPALDVEPARGLVCRYTDTPTGHFLLDRHPDTPAVHLVSPCSGHGFKFASAIGEVVARRVLGEADEGDLSLFRMERALGVGR